MNNKVIIWGHKLHSHTHSYIHHAFFRAFAHRGDQAYWFENDDDVSNFDFSNCIFLTEGQVDAKMPVRKDCKYILHNCDMAKYADVAENCLQIQVYTRDVHNYNLEHIGNHMYYKDRLLYLYWATDLLPNEIEYKKTDHENNVYWIGTIGAGKFGNIDQISRFQNACTLNGIRFMHRSGVSFKENRDLVARSYMAPAINGTWQIEKGYIPCRIFKNISYGQMGLTNNSDVQDLCCGQLVYSEDCFTLFEKAKERMAAADYEKQILWLMHMVKTEHTYLNRIETILKFL